MTDHEAEIATLHQENTQLRARINRLELALRMIAEDKSGKTWMIADIIARNALQEHGE